MPRISLCKFWEALRDENDNARIFLPPLNATTSILFLIGFCRTGSFPARQDFLAEDSAEGKHLLVDLYGPTQDLGR